MDHIRQDEVSLPLVFKYTWKNKYWLFATLCVSVGLAVYLSLQLPNLYRSEARIVAANETQGKAGGLSSQLSSVSALAGINLGGGGEKKSVIALEMMRSRQFFNDFAEKHQILTPLVAGFRWDIQKDQVLLDPEMYDVSAGKWIRPGIELRKAEPSMLEGYEQFMKRFNSSQDKLTGVVTVSFEFISPTLAQQWLKLYLDEINDVMRKKDIEEAESAISYLNQQIEQTQLAEVKTALFGLIEEHTKTLTMANARKEYVFKTIDPPYKPEVKSGPMRSVIVLFTAVVHCFLFVLLVMLYLLFTRNKVAQPVKEGI